jgi:predicted short-subunit dehydrogenase-like oxidoreductase (DUF2520 family)
VVAEADRAEYAEAIATARGFSAAIVEQAAGMLHDIGIERPGVVLGPLVRSSVENALSAADVDAAPPTTIDLAPFAEEGAEEAP